MSGFRTGWVFLPIVLWAGGSGFAQWQAPSATFRGFVEYAYPTRTDTVSVLGVEAAPSLGFGFVFELRPSYRVGLEFGVMRHEFDVDVTSVFGVPADGTIGSTHVFPVTFGVDFHLLGRNAALDLYAAPIVSYQLWGDLETPNTADLDIENAFGFGAAVGLDVPIGGSGLQFNAAVRYLALGARTETDTIDIDPAILQIGVGYRW